MRAKLIRGTIEERFWPKVQIRGEDECWEWQASRRRHGYGQFMVGPKGGQRALPAHRVAWELANEKSIPAGMLVMHTCDNPPCCNPGHLRLGTHRENMNDRNVKGRLARGGRDGNAKLTEDDVREIRKLHEQNLATQVQLAAMYSVSQPAISAIITRRTWTHI